MSDKGLEGSDKMSVDFVISAKDMSEFILRSTYRGPGDTVDAAMHRAERLYGAPASWMHRLRYRSIRDMPVSAYAAIAQAYKNALAASERAYASERERAHARNSKLIGIADALAGTPAIGSMAAIAPVLVEAGQTPEKPDNFPDTN